MTDSRNIPHKRFQRFDLCGAESPKFISYGNILVVTKPSSEHRSANLKVACGFSCFLHRLQFLRLQSGYRQDKGAWFAFAFTPSFAHHT
jgi:hypothetical protein